MARNVEIKARVSDLHRLEALAASMSDQPGEEIVQQDIFLNVPQGRLKLRMLGPELGQLIYYQRQDQAGPKLSDYLLFETRETEKLLQILTLALGVRGIVRKRRLLYRVGRTRVHLDRVEGLGDFLELEVVLDPAQTIEEGQEIARQLMEKLGIQEEQLVDVAYLDLLDRR